MCALCCADDLDSSRKRAEEDLKKLGKPEVVKDNITCCTAPTTFHGVLLFLSQNLSRYEAISETHYKKHKPKRDINMVKSSSSSSSSSFSSTKPPKFGFVVMEEEDLY